MNEGDWFYNSVMWAVKNGVTVGTTPTTFEPYTACTRAQMIEFLWNAVGKPAATIKSVPFTDVPESGSDDYWYEASLLWAYEAGIVAGTNDGSTFSPDQVCTRAEMISFIARLLSDGATDNMPFVDVPASAWYYNEVQWAWANGLTVGTSATTFSPDKACNRAEAVEFLYNAFAELRSSLCSIQCFSIRTSVANRQIIGPKAQRRDGKTSSLLFLHIELTNLERKIQKRS